MAYYDFLNVVFAPLLKLPDVWAVLLLSLLVSVIVILVTKYATDQQLMKKLKEDMKDYQKQIKELKGNPAKAMEVQKKAMELNMKYMTHSFRPTIITIIPILLIFGWMSSVFAYESIKPQQEFNIYAVFDKNVNGEAEIFAGEGIEILGDKKAEITAGEFNRRDYDKLAEWTLKGKEGEHLIEISYDNEKQQHTVLITNGDEYPNPDKKSSGSIKLIHIDYKKKTLIPIGYRDWLGWLGTYILSSIAFTMSLRKVMKVY